MDTTSENSWPLVGNQHIAEFLSRSFKKGITAGAYIFAGPEGLGKSTAARYFAQLLLCQKIVQTAECRPCGQCDSCRRLAGDRHGAPGSGLDAVHGDFALIEKEAGKKSLSISQVREFIDRMNKGSFFGAYKIGIIKDADSLSDEAANGLLKTLEEPKIKTVIIITVVSPDNLPLTIASRSQILNFSLVRTDDLYQYLVAVKGSARPAAKIIARLALGRPALAAKYHEDKDFLASRLGLARAFLACLEAPIFERFSILAGLAEDEKLADQVPNFINSWQGVIRDLILSSFGHYDLVENQESLKEIKRLSLKIPPRRIIELYRLFGESRAFLAGNVHPRTVLDNILIGL